MSDTKSQDCSVYGCVWNRRRALISCRSEIVFNVHGSVHRKDILIYFQQDATLHGLFYLETALHVSGGTTTHHQERKQLVVPPETCRAVSR